MKNKNYSLEEIEQFILEMGSDDLPIFGGKYMGGIHAQQMSDELGPCILSILESGEAIKSYLEIGVAAGGMTFLIDHFFKPDKIILIDDNRHWKAPLRHGVLKNIKRVEIIGNSRDPEVIKKISDSFDLIVIDGDHRYEGVMADVKNYLPMLNVGGFLFFHDSVLPGSDVGRVVQEMKVETFMEFVGEYISTKNSQPCGVALFRKTVRIEKNMNVEIITCMYNEEFLLPFFLKHYDWVDKITILFGEDSTDESKSILEKNPKVEIIPLTMPNGIDDGIKTEKINEAYLRSNAEWVLILDSDEFAFLGRDDLNRIGSEYNLARISFPHVYRHQSEGDLDLSRPVEEQRRHGYLAQEYIKPSLARGGQDLLWNVGAHGVTGKYRINPGIFSGAHWANADPCFCIERRIKGRKERLSPTNIEKKWGHGNFSISRESISAECKAHENDPEVLGGPKISFGVMTNHWARFDMALRQSEISGQVHYIENPESATKGLNKLLDIMEKEGADVAALVHQDMSFRRTWVPQIRAQISNLPESWVTAGIIGKDMKGRICGVFNDTRIPQIFNTADIHTFPQSACCFDECCIFVNLRKGFRFDETFDGFDLYGTLAVLQTWEMGGKAFIVDSGSCGVRAATNFGDLIVDITFAQHHCTRPFTWVPDEKFIRNYKWLYDKFTEIERLDSTAIGCSEETKIFKTSAGPESI